MKLCGTLFFILLFPLHGNIGLSPFHSPFFRSYFLILFSSLPFLRRSCFSFKAPLKEEAKNTKKKNLLPWRKKRRAEDQRRKVNTKERERIDTRYRFFVPPICLRSLHLIFQLLQHSYTHYSNLLLYTDRPTKVTTERNHCCQTDQDQRRQLRSTILLSVATFLLSFIHLDFFIFGPSRVTTSRLIL